jgi:uncharacterized protein YbjQ (UPF0145 family)
MRLESAAMECDDDEMLIATTNDLPGYRIEEVYGEVTGLTARARNIGAQFGAGLKSLVGGELKGLTKQLMQSREEALARLMEAATSRGANAVIAMRFDANEVSAGYQEIVAYGTAVRVTKNAWPKQEWTLGSWLQIAQTGRRSARGRGWFRRSARLPDRLLRAGQLGRVAVPPRILAARTGELLIIPYGPGKTFTTKRHSPTRAGRSPVGAG